MILSFSVPDNNPKYQPIINWYQSYDENKSKRMERSRDFRELFLKLLGGNAVEIRVEKEIVMEEAPPRAMTTEIPIQLVSVVATPQQPSDEELDRELDNLTF